MNSSTTFILMGLLVAPNAAWLLEPGMVQTQAFRSPSQHTLNANLRATADRIQQLHIAQHRLSQSMQLVALQQRHQQQHQALQMQLLQHQFKQQKLRDLISRNSQGVTRGIIFQDSTVDESVILRTDGSLTAKLRLGNGRTDRIMDGEGPVAQPTSVPIGLRVEFEDRAGQAMLRVLQPGHSDWTLKLPVGLGVSKSDVTKRIKAQVEGDTLTIKVAPMQHPRSPGAQNAADATQNNSMDAHNHTSILTQVPASEPVSELVSEPMILPATVATTQSQMSEPVPGTAPVQVMKNEIPISWERARGRARTIRAEVVAKSTTGEVAAEVMPKSNQGGFSPAAEFGRADLTKAMHAAEASAIHHPSSSSMVASVGSRAVGSRAVGSRAVGRRAVGRRAGVISEAQRKREQSARARMAAEEAAHVPQAAGHGDTNFSKGADEEGALPAHVEEEEEVLDIDMLESAAATVTATNRIKSKTFPRVPGMP